MTLGEYDNAIQLLKTKKIDFQNDYSTEGFVSYLYHIWTNKTTIIITASQQKELFDIFLKAGIVTRESMSLTFLGPESLNILTIAAVNNYTHTDSFEFVLLNAPKESLDWNVQSNKDRLWSPLLRVLATDVSFSDTKEAQKLHDVLDKRATKLINMVSDQALNVIDLHNYTPFIWAIQNSYTSALTALIEKISVLDISNSERITAALAENKKISRFPHLYSKVCTLISIARVMKQQYQTMIKPLTKEILERYLIIAICDCVESYIL